MVDIPAVSNHLAELEEELERLSKATNEITTAKEAASKAVSASQSVLSILKQVAIDFQHLSKSNEAVTQRIHEALDGILRVDFPSRLDKLDNTVSAVSIGVQNLATDFHDLARRLEESNDQIGALHSALRIQRWMMFSVLGLLTIATVLSIIMR